MKLKASYGKHIKRFFSLLLCCAGIRIIAPVPAYPANLTYVKPLFEINSQFTKPSDVAVANDGRIYVVDGVNNAIKVFDSKGKYIFSFGKQGSGKGEVRSPLGIDIDSQGTVYIADSGNHRVQIFNPDGVYLSEILIPPATKPSDPTDMAVDEDRNRCYIVDNDNHRILVYDLATLKQITVYGSPGSEKRAFRYPFFINLDKENYLYIVDVINTRVQVLNPDGKFVTFIGGWGVEPGEFFRPKGVAIDIQNRIFVSDSYIGVIQVFSHTGDLISVVGDPELNKIKKFNTPVGICIDSNNRLYVVEMLAQKVSVYKIVK